MGQAGEYLRRIEGGYAHWCPACEEIHAIAVDRPQRNGARWTFDGNLERPTFNPSVNISWGWPDKAETLARCHYVLHAGEIQFCADCTHQLAGQTVPLPALPPGYRDEVND